MFHGGEGKRMICAAAPSAVPLVVVVPSAVCRLPRGRRFLCRRPRIQMIMDGGNRNQREPDLQAHARGRSAEGRWRTDTLNMSRQIWMSNERECLRDNLVHPF